MRPDTPPRFKRGDRVIYLRFRGTGKSRGTVLALGGELMPTYDTEGNWRYAVIWDRYAGKPGAGRTWVAEDDLDFENPVDSLGRLVKESEPCG